MTVSQLPNEILEAILLRLPPLPHSKESVRTLCRIGQANSRFLAISRLPRIWQGHFAVQWARADTAREDIRKSSTHGDWWRMYIARSRIDSRALELLDAIIAASDNRALLAIELAKDLGYDVWEAIFKQTSCVHYCEIKDKISSDGFNIPIEGLTRKYWADEVLGVISRVRAVGIWLPLADPLAEDVSFEKGLTALSGFFGQDIDKMFEELDRLALNCQTYLSDQGILDFFDLTDVIIQICAWMRQQGFVKTDLTNYHNLLNHFPHRVLFEQPVTLPMSLVYVFVCIARRLGLNACPVAFPHKVLAVVSPTVGNAIYVDVFESATHPILSYSSDLPLMLLGMGLNPVTLPQYVAPTSTATMLLRAVRNIIHSLERIMSWSEGDQMSSHYAAYCAALLLTGDARLVQALFVVGVGGPLDSEVVLKCALRPCLPVRAREELDLCLAKQADSETSVPRTTGRHGILHFIGMVFRHKKYLYVGLIKGWDYRCEAGDEWIHRMQVNDLLRGKYQPFYHSFTADGHTRYVAEENIEPLARPTPSELRVLIDANKELGRWFDGVDLTASGTARFRLSPESHRLYPEDDVAGREFIN